MATQINAIYTTASTMADTNVIEIIAVCGVGSVTQIIHAERIIEPGPCEIAV
jgi:hypothetical protein